MLNLQSFLSVNLAHNRTVSQSSQVPGFPPILSVDGDPTTCAKTLVVRKLHRIHDTVILLFTTTVVT